MIPINISYSIGLDISKQVGTNPSAYSKSDVSFLEQAQFNTIQNAQEYIHPFYLAGNAVENISLVNLGFKFIKLVLIKTDNIIRYTYTNASSVTVVESSLIFLDKKVPTTIPARPDPDTHSIAIANINSTITEGVLYLVGIK